MNFFKKHQADNQVAMPKKATGALELTQAGNIKFASGDREKPKQHECSIWCIVSMSAPIYI